MLGNYCDKAQLADAMYVLDLGYVSQFQVSRPQILKYCMFNFAARYIQNHESPVNPPALHDKDALPAGRY